MNLLRIPGEGRLGACILVLGACALPANRTVAAQLPAVEKSVVKIFSTYRNPDPYRPWTKLPPSDATGTGTVIDGKRILTNAHMVLYASEIQVQANQSGDKIYATVEAVAPGIDLAILKLDDESFFDTHAALPRADALPDIRDSVLAYGYPTGGDGLSITKGIVSRIEFVSYSNTTSGMRIQIDAAINHGNSGGPALVGGRMIGIAFSMLGNAQNIGYIIPCEEIELFLKEISNGRYAGKPGIFDEFQKLQNPALRSSLKVGKSVSGYVVRAPFRTDPGYPLRQWDAVSRIGDTPVDDEGMIDIGSNLRVRFDYLVQKLEKDGIVPLTVVRDGREVAIQLPVDTTRPMVVPDLMGAYPPYFVFGPLVFSVATAQFIAGIDRPGIDNLIFIGSPLIARRFAPPAFEGEQLVIVSSPFFPHRLSEGYLTNPTGWVVRAVDGTRIRNLNHLVEVLRDARGEFVTIDFDGRYLERFVLPRREALADTEGILADNGVRAQGSPDAMAVWTARPK